MQTKEKRLLLAPKSSALSTENYAESHKQTNFFSMQINLTWNNTQETSPDKKNKKKKRLANQNCLLRK